jgi:uncharacterized protein YcfL
MKKICVFALLIALLMLTGCKNSQGQTFKEYLIEEYPYIEYRNSSLNFDTKNEKIKVIDGYILNQGNSYEWVETEDGYDLIVHFVKGE